MNSLSCEFCNNTFTCTSALNRHQRTTKKCVSSKQLFNNEIKQFTCNQCLKNFTSKNGLDYHMNNSCKVKKEQDNLKAELEALKEKVKILEEKPTTTINNITNNTINNSGNINIVKYITPELVRKTFKDHYTSETLKGGESALADFAIEHFLTGLDKSIYICTDRSRRKFFYFDGDKPIEDPNADIFTELISSGYFETIQKYYEMNLKDLDEKIELNSGSKDITNYLNKQKDTLRKNYLDLKKIKKEGEDYRNRLSKKLPKSVFENENLIKSRQEILERNELERKTLESIKDELEMIPGLNMRRHNPTGMVFNSSGRVVGKYYWNTEEDVGFDDYSELTDVDASVCKKNNFDMARYQEPVPLGFFW